MVVSGDHIGDLWPWVVGGTQRGGAEVSMSEGIEHLKKPQGSLSTGTIVRVLVQLWFTWHAVILMPVLVYMSVRNMMQPRPANLMVYAFMLLPVCCVFLMVSIFAPQRWYRRRRLGWFLMLMLLLGCACVGVLARIFFTDEDLKSYKDYHMLFGPVVVALWNVVRIARVQWKTAVDLEPQAMNP